MWCRSTVTCGAGPTSISAALLGVLLCWFVIPGEVVPVWAVAIAVLLLFIAVVPLMRDGEGRLT